MNYTTLEFRGPINIGGTGYSRIHAKDGWSFETLPQGVVCTNSTHRHFIPWADISPSPLAPPEAPAPVAPPSDKAPAPKTKPRAK